MPKALHCRALSFLAFVARFFELTQVSVVSG
jgi:hypothetical protein